MCGHNFSIGFVPRVFHTLSLRYRLINRSCALLHAEAYDGDDDMSWVLSYILLAPTEGAGIAGPSGGGVADVGDA